MTYSREEKQRELIKINGIFGLTAVESTHPPKPLDSRPYPRQGSLAKPLPRHREWFWGCGQLCTTRFDLENCSFVKWHFFCAKRRTISMQTVEAKIKRPATPILGAIFSAHKMATTVAPIHTR